MSVSDEDDRREFPRLDAELAARVSANGHTVAADTVNISEGGILLAGSDFPSAARVRVEIELAELGWHAMDAEILRHEDTRDGERMAARFARAATEGGREAIRAFFVKRLGGAAS